MKKWLDFLSEQIAWRSEFPKPTMNGVQNVGDSQVTSPQSMISTNQDKADQDKTEIWPLKPSPDFDHSHKKPDLSAKVDWLNTMVDLINSKRIQQMELNQRIINRLGRLEKVAKLPPELNGNGNGNGATW